MKGLLRLGPATVAGPLRGHKPVTIRTSPRVEPRWLGPNSWARSTSPTADNPRAWKSPSFLASPTRLWVSCWYSFVELTLSIEWPPNPQIRIQSARLDIPERCLGSPRTTSSTDSRHRHVRTAGAHSVPPPVPRPSLPLNAGLPKLLQRCSWRTIAVSRTSLGHPGSVRSIPEGA
jgi:hypothetical protein